MFSAFGSLQGILRLALPALLGLVLWSPLPAFGFNVAIALSQKIHPYMQAVSGLKSAWSEQQEVSWDILLLEKKNELELENLKQRLQQEPFDLIVTIGPEATSFLHSLKSEIDAPIIYSMVLDSDKLISDSVNACGISLFIPVGDQIQAISASLPQVKRIGLLYTPKYNAEFVLQARAAGSQQADLRVIPLPIASQEDIPSTLEENWDRLDGLWLIPDRTVISKRLVQYIIKEALYNEVPVIGYNRFFYQTGAAMAFIFDYQAIGRQTGNLARQWLTSHTCRQTVPAFEVRLNERVLDKLGLNREQNPDADQ